MSQSNTELQDVRQILKEMDMHYQGHQSFHQILDRPNANMQETGNGRNDTVVHGYNVSTSSSDNAFSPDSNEDILTMESLNSIIQEDMDESPVTLISNDMRCAIFDNHDKVDDQLMAERTSSLTIDRSQIEHLISTDNSVIESKEASVSVDTIRTFGNHFLMVKSNETNQKIDIERKRKDDHNIIERRRRYNINDKIKELSTLLPKEASVGVKLNKGAILRSTVEYVKSLKKDKKKLHELIEKQASEDIKKQRMLTKIFRLQLKLKLLSFCEGFNKSNSNRGKGMNDCLTDIDELVKGLLKESNSRQTENYKTADDICSKRQTSSRYRRSKPYFKKVLSQRPLRQAIEAKVQLGSVPEKNKSNNGRKMFMTELNQELETIEAQTSGILESLLRRRHVEEEAD